MSINLKSDPVPSLNLLSLDFKQFAESNIFKCATPQAKADFVEISAINTHDSADTAEIPVGQI
jgi:hypothetical protein